MIIYNGQQYTNRKQLATTLGISEYRIFRYYRESSTQQEFDRKISDFLESVKRNTLKLLY